MKELNTVEDSEKMLSELEQQTQILRRIDFLFGYAAKFERVNCNPLLPVIYKKQLIITN